MLLNTCCSITDDSSLVSTHNVCVCVCVSMCKRVCASSCESSGDLAHGRAIALRGYVVDMTQHVTLERTIAHHLAHGMARAKYLALLRAMAQFVSYGTSEHNANVTQHLTNDMGMAQLLVRDKLMAQHWTTEWHAINRKFVAFPLESNFCEDF